MQLHQVCYNLIIFLFNFQNFYLNKEPPKTTPQPIVNTVIETKPPILTTVKPIVIKPSKPIVQKTQKPQVLSSVIQVVANPPVQAKQPVSSVVNIFSSHVEVVTEAPKTTTKVEIIQQEEEEQEEEEEEEEEFEEENEEEEEEEPQLIQSIISKVDESPIILSSIVEVHSNEDEEPILQIGNNIGEPEYDFLSRQPSEFVEETYRVKNLRPSNVKFAHKPRATADHKPRNLAANRREDTHPTGLVTKLGGTVVKDGVTTVHETSVLGTYISGKYAQVLQSSSQIIQPNVKPKPTPTSSLRILKTAAPSIPKANRINLEPTPSTSSTEETAGLPVESLFGSSDSPNLVRPSRRPANPSGSFKNRFRNRNIKEDSSSLQDVTEEVVTPSQSSNSFSGGKRPHKNRNHNKPKK